MAGRASSQARLAPVDQKTEPPARSRSKSPQPNKKSKNSSKPVEKVKDHDIFLLPATDYGIMLLLTVAAGVVRTWRIWQPTSVVFDEVHFGGFATKYIKGKFFMDVHPPLAKMLIALVGWLAGFTGDFDFKEIGKDYLEPGVPYVYMRLLPAIMGTLVVPMMFLTLKAAGCSTATATMGSGFIIFENGLLTQARLILLDSPLVMFTALTATCWTSFLNVHEQGHSQAFSHTWWFWLVCTGLSLGATVSVKWVGLFTIAWVGALTVLQLWFLLGDAKNVSARLWFKHFFARALCLIVIPVVFYMAMFAIHFVCLVNPGDGDGFMSSAFQSTLNSKGMKDVPADVAFGSRVAIRHWNTQGGYLHSHNHMYPTGSKQQQVTLYPHKDENNMFVLENETYHEGGVGIGGFDDVSPPILIEDGAKVRLYHITTDRRLHSHDVKPPITEADWQFEVSAYGYKGFEGDANDIFRVEIIPHLSDGPVAKTRLRTIQTKFKLVHVMTGCVLFSHKVKLPDWAFEQQEVTCARGSTLPNSVWFVEGNEHPQLQGDVEKVNYKNPGFFGKFWELNKVMWRTNAGLVDSHAWDSRPEAWPFLKRGINFWGRENRQVYLIGNPFIWWSSTAAVVIYVAFKGIAVLRWQRGFDDYQVENWRRFDYELGTSILGWALHYFPFYLMKRQLFLHHYFPALYFAIAAFCQIFDFVGFRIKSVGLGGKPALGWVLAVLFLALSAAVFKLYQPLAYGDPWTKSECKRVKLFTGWDWDCNVFHDSYDKYSGTSSSTPAAQPTNGTSVEGVKENVQSLQGETQKASLPSSNMVTPSPKVPAYDDTEEAYEYRDADGNILDEEQVKALEGKVEFVTTYQTRTRVVDEFGNELPEDYVLEKGEESVPTIIETKYVEVSGSPEKDGTTTDTDGRTYEVHNGVPTYWVVEEVPGGAETVEVTATVEGSAANAVTVETTVEMTVEAPVVTVETAVGSVATVETTVEASVVTVETTVEAPVATVETTVEAPASVLTTTATAETVIVEVQADAQTMKVEVTSSEVAGTGFDTVQPEAVPTEADVEEQIELHTATQNKEPKATSASRPADPAPKEKQD